jgi:hypothetical protein
MVAVDRMPKSPCQGTFTCVDNSIALCIVILTSIYVEGVLFIVSHSTAAVLEHCNTKLAVSSSAESIFFLWFILPYSVGASHSVNLQLLQAGLTRSKNMP